MPKVKGNDIDICRQRWEEIQRLTKEAKIHEAEYACLESSAEAFTRMVESLGKEVERLKIALDAADNVLRRYCDEYAADGRRAIRAALETNK